MYVGARRYLSGRLGLVAAAGLVLLVCAATAGVVWVRSEPGPGVSERQDRNQARFDEVVEALRNKDVGSVVARLAYRSLACGVPVTVSDHQVPGPICQGSETHGTPVAVFPFVRCDVTFVRAAAAPALVTKSLEGFELYGGVRLRKPIRHSDYSELQDGSYGVVGKVGLGRMGAMVSVDTSGSVVNLWPGCGEFASGLIDDRFAEAVLFGPFR